MYDVRDAEGGATLRVRVSPRASRDTLAGERQGALVVRITAPPVDGAAGRDKLLHVSGLDAASLLARLDSAGGAAR